MNTIFFSLRLLILWLWCSSIISNGQQVERAEYFIDLDPGQGKGKTISITPANPVEFSVEVETTGLSPGVHTLCIRVRDNSGTWGLIESQPFYIQNTHPNTTSNIIAAEYFFDEEPGIGNGIALSINAAMTLDFNGDIPVAGLEKGVHTIYVRVQNSKGVWSLFHEMSFYLEKIDQVTSSISAIEYFVDADPGLGSGTRAANNTNELVVPTDDLTPGVHSLYVRAKDSRGVWGIVEKRDFLIEEKLGELSTLVSAEYFFDNKKPTPGTGIELEFEPTSNLGLEKKIEAALPEGSHTLSLQLKDSKGNYSSIETKEFIVATPRIDEISPSYGGNIGDVSVNILGASFENNPKVLLRRSGLADIVVEDSMKYVTNGEQIMATFDLRGMQVGSYDVVVILEDGTTLELQNGFEIKEGIKADPWAEVIGFDRIRRGQWQSYTVSYGNNGNVDANGVPLWLVIGQDTTVAVELDFEISKNEKYSVALDSIPLYFTADSLFGEKYDCKIYPLYIPNIRAGAVETLNIRVRALNNFQLFAYATTPLYQSPFSENASECLTNIFQDKVVMKVADDILKSYKKALPGAGCVISVLETHTAYKKYIRKKDDAPSGLSLMWDMASSVFDCASDVIPAKAVYRFSKALWRTAHGFYIAKGALELANDKLIPCSEAFRVVKKKLIRKIKDLEIKDIINIASFDPNDKLGSVGAGSNNYLKGDAPFQYLIRFENKPSASAAAQTVLIIDTLDNKSLDLSTLELTFFSFGKKTFNIPPGRKNYTAEVDLRPANNLILKVEITLDEETGVLKWLYSSLDPYSRSATEDPEAGFLPPNLNAPEGEGGVFFTIRPKEELITDSKISNKAYIYFDTNEVIPTPPWSNAIDKSIPESKISLLQDVQQAEFFEINWEGQDTGAGIRYYSIFYSKNDGPFELWRDTASTSAIFKGEFGSTYKFYSNAVDSAGNFEKAPLVADAQTRIQNVTSTEREIWNRLEVYPNPAGSKLTIKRPLEIMNSKIYLVSPQGYLVKVLDVNEHDEVDISKFGRGFFLLGFEFEGRRMYKKVIFE